MNSYTGKYSPTHPHSLIWAELKVQIMHSGLDPNPTDVSRSFFIDFSGGWTGLQFTVHGPTAKLQLKHKHSSKESHHRATKGVRPY